MRQEDWLGISPQEASTILFHRITELLLTEAYKISTDPVVRLLTQRLYGDYRQIHLTNEYKRANKHVHHYKNTGLGKQLF